MGLLDWLMPRLDIAEGIQAALYDTDPDSLPIGSPWGSPDSNLRQIIFEDIYGQVPTGTTRSAAMAIPALARARNTVVTLLSGAPLAVADASGPLDVQPSWLTATSTGTIPTLWRAWTVDDLIFHGWSCSRRINGPDGYPAAPLARVPRSQWTINADNRVVINGIPQNDEDIVLIPGLHEGILTFGREAIQDARTLYEIVRGRLRNPVPQVDLHQTGGEPLTGEEIDALINGWVAARQGANGGVAYTNQTVEARELGGGSDAAQLMIEARNATALDMARIVGVHGSIVDATTPKASLNYETTEGRNEELVDFDLNLYLLPITARLSQDDLLSPGQHVYWDLTQLTGPNPSPTGPTLKD